MKSNPTVCTVPAKAQQIICFQILIQQPFECYNGICLRYYSGSTLKAEPLATNFLTPYYFYLFCQIHSFYILVLNNVFIYFVHSVHDFKQTLQLLLFHRELFQLLHTLYLICIIISVNLFCSFYKTSMLS